MEHSIPLEEDSGSPLSSQLQQELRQEQQQEQRGAAAAAAGIGTTFLEEEDEEEEDPRLDKSPSFATPESGASGSQSSEHESTPTSKHPHQRFLELQAFLKFCDEADQKDLIEALGSLSAAGRSGHAFNLEYRALMLSIEEGKEMVRLKMLNVLGKHKKSSPGSSSSQEAGNTPVGVRLPAPGTDTEFVQGSPSSGVEAQGALS